ncbi:MAG: metallophosphoesterase [Clostridia bacterium]|nr:metallophosphoesterase [Clostridia bacterium]
MRNTRYRLRTGVSRISFKTCIVADLHDRPYGQILPILKQEKPDLVLIPGDVTETLRAGEETTERNGLRLLTECAAIAPTFYTFGNHEIGGCHGNIRLSKMANEPLTFTLTSAWKGIIESTGVVLLRQSYTVWNGLAIGGLGSGLLNPGWKPELDWLDAYVSAKGYKLLMSHHPEYYDRYLRPYPIDLTVSGHAHGGQWRVLGRGVYAPDQGLFPKYTGGLHENRLVISRGVANTVPCVPRFFNPCEVVTVEVNAE